MNKNVDSKSPAEFLNKYFSELKNIFDSIDGSEFNKFIFELIGAYDRGSNIFILGNGGSASTASHFVCDINKGVSFGKEKRFKVICLSDNIPIIMAYGNDISYDNIFIEQLKNFINKDDLIIGISGSGNSENVLKAINYANSNGGKTFGICGNGGNKLKDITHNSIVIENKDMQKIEDVHLIILHCTMQWLNLTI